MCSFYLTRVQTGSSTEMSLCSLINPPLVTFTTFMTRDSMSSAGNESEMSASPSLKQQQEESMSMAATLSVQCVQSGICIFNSCDDALVAYSILVFILLCLTKIEELKSSYNLQTPRQ